MGSLVKPLGFNPAVPDYTAWQENHARAHSVLDQLINQLGAGKGTKTSSSGIYLPQFKSGPVQYAGPNGSFLGNNNLIFGTGIPNPAHDFPSGGGVSLLIGTGGTDNPNRDAWIITDQAFDDTLAGNTLGITAGETQGSGTANGGLLWLLGGGSFGGTGGELRVQAGTSRNGPGGPLNLFGGNSTSGIPGDVFIVGGQAGSQGANIHLIMTQINGIAGFLRIRVNSTILYEFDATGAIFIGASGAGLVGSPLVSGGPTGSPQWLNTAFTGTVTLAKLTTGGSNGSLVFASGLCTSVTQPT
jgi:hypothetical protein